MDTPLKTYFFCGVGGSGMSAIAALLASRGHTVFGSDRSYDKGQRPDKFKKLANSGIHLVAQDGHAVTDKIDFLVVSSAVEPTIPDVAKAQRLNIPILKRAELLAALFNDKKGIAIGGTSGKTTVTAMIGHIFHKARLSPTIINGGILGNLYAESLGLGNVVAGNGAWVIAEADESDGSIALYNPVISVLTNITLDHKPIAELKPLFQHFIQKATLGAVVSGDDPEIKQLDIDQSRCRSVSVQNTHCDYSVSHIRQEPFAVHAQLRHRDHEKTYSLSLQVPGIFNLSNALLAIAAAMLAGIDIETCVAALKDFKTAHRRMEKIGDKNGITVIDDFAHNPDKIAASLSALGAFEGRVLVVFQPHGFAPIRLMGADIAKTFMRQMGRDDIVLMPEIYYAGGTTTRDVSSKSIISTLNDAGYRAEYFETREDILPYIKEEARSGDRIVIMGARDDTLPDYAKNILDLF